MAVGDDAVESISVAAEVADREDLSTVGTNRSIDIGYAMRSTGRQGVFVGGVGDPVVRDENSDGAGSNSAS